MTDGYQMRYYSIMRPVSIGTCPAEGMVSYHNFDNRTYVEAIDREAWGYIEYSRELTEQEYMSYELFPENIKRWYCVFVTRWIKSGNMKGNVNARVLKERYAINKPEDFTYEPESKTRICTAKWYGNIDEANKAVADALAGNKEGNV